MDSLIVPIMDYIEPLPFFYEDGFYKVHTPLKKETTPKPKIISIGFKFHIVLLNLIWIYDAI